MSSPSPEVLQDINTLISTVTGFKPHQENYAACKKYCLSHFMHHTYPSVSKSTIQDALKEYERRFYIQARFELSQCLNEQVNNFLSNEDTFKNNPECEIEWNVLSFVISLSSNLSNLIDVPKLLPLNDEEEPTVDIDWASYLKEGLPVYDYDSGSDTFSSLSSISSDPSPLSKSTDNFVSALEDVVPTSPDKPCTLNDIHAQRYHYLDKLKKREEDYNVDVDIAKKGYLASRWKDLAGQPRIEISPIFIISEKEAIEKIIFCLVTGDNFNGIKNCTVSFLSRDSFMGFLKILDPYVQAMNVFQTFLKSVESEMNYNSVVVRTYASCLKHYLMQYELKMLEISNEKRSLIQLLQPIQPCLPYILGLFSAHKFCVSTWRCEPVWVTSLKTVSTLFSCMTESHRQDLRSTFLGIFLSCLTVYGDIINELVTSTNEVDIYQEFFIERQVSEDKFECRYLLRSDCKPLLNNFKLADAIFNKIEESTLSLALLYVMNQYQYRNDAQDGTSINAYLCKALKAAYKQEGLETENSNNVLKAMSNLSVREEDIFDFLQVPKWLEKSDCHTPVYKIISNALINAIDEKLDYIQNHAINILVNEMGIEKHLNMLRRVLLFNDASILLPFLTVYFYEEGCWSNSDYLTFLLRECIVNDFPDQAEHISVKATRGSSVSYQNIIEAIDCINIEYEVAYPISLVISAEIMRKYNAIFRILLKVKWSHTLVNLPFPDKKIEFTPAAQYVLHRLQILRFSCLADLNLIQNYFMAQVAATLSHCADYQDIHTLIYDHEALIDRIYARCMLSEGDQYYNLIFDSVMPLCFNLRNAWYLQDVQIVATLKQMESIFRTSHAKLQRIMVSLEKETYEPLLVKVKENITYVTHPTLQI